MGPDPPFQGCFAWVQPVKTAHQQWKRCLSCMPSAADVKHGGDVGLAAQAAANRGTRPNGLSPPLRGDQVHLDSPSKPITLGCDHNPFLCSRNEQISACGGIRLTQSDDGSFVGRFRSLLLPSADNAFAAPTPGQTARQRVLRVRPAAAEPDPEAVDGCLVWSCCSPGYA